jgi:hypothetical protein
LRLNLFILNSNVARLLADSLSLTFATTRQWSTSHKVSSSKTPDASYVLMTSLSFFFVKTWPIWLRVCHTVLPEWRYNSVEVILV